MTELQHERAGAIRSDPEVALWARRAYWLVVLTLAYNVAEAFVAVALGWIDRSVVLVGFGLDSVIEAVAAVAVLQRVRAMLSPQGADAAETLELRTRRVVGVTFLALAAYIAAQSAYVLAAGKAPEQSWLGILLSLFSLVVMPVVAVAKLRCAERLRSPALRAEAKETLACSYLSLTLFLGLAGNAFVGWWWTDPVAALLMTPWLVREGIEGLRGECSCH